MKTSDAGIALLKQFEGCRLTAYQLAGEKYYTIGYGHYGADVFAGMTISQAQAEAMLRVDLEKYEKFVEQYVTDITLNQNQFDALVSYTYNRGSGGIKQLATNCHTVAEYSAGFITYWGSAVRYKDALLKRRAKERELFDTPVVAATLEAPVPVSAENKVLAIKVIDAALEEVGYLEKKTNAQLDDKTANAGSNNYTKYARDYAKHSGINVQGQPWCDVFVDEMFVKAFGVEAAKKLLGGFSAYTPTSAQYFKNRKQWYTSAPKPGDIIFFKNTQRICHTGIVEKADNKYVYTIEGNTSGASGVIANGGGVCRKTYDLNNARIAGYGRPAYDTVVATTESTAKHEQKTYEVKRGYQTLVDLNVRNTPGSSSNANKLGKIIPAGTWVENQATQKVGNAIWMQIPSDYVNGKFTEQWVCADNGTKTYIG